MEDEQSSTEREVTYTKASMRSIDLQRELEHIRESLKKVSKIAQTDILNSKKIHESEVQKTRNLHIKESLSKVFNNFRSGPEIFHLIVKYLKGNKLKLIIPDTLIFLPDFTYPAFIFNKPDGFIEIDLSRYSETRFFDKNINKNESQSDWLPKFVHIAMNQRIKLCFSAEEAKKVFEECPHFSHRLQKWLPGNSNFASKIRVHWKVSKPPAVYILANKVPLARRASSNLKTRSFLPLVKSSGKGPLEHKNLQDLSKWIDSGEEKQFLVQFTSSENLNVTQCTRFVPELHEPLNAVITVMNSMFFHNPNKLQDLLLDFIKSGKNWVLISCKGHKVKGDSKFPPVKKTEIDGSENRPVRRRNSVIYFDSVTEESLKSDESFNSYEEENDEIERNAKRFESLAKEMLKKHNPVSFSVSSQNYLDLKQGDSFGRIPHIMIGLVPHKIEKPITYFIEKNKEAPVKPVKHEDRGNQFWAGKETINPQKYSKITSKCLNDVVKVYNKHRSEAKLGRLNIVDKKILQDIYNENLEDLQDLISEVYSIKNTNFHHYIEAKSIKDLRFKAKKMLEYLNQSSEFLVRKKVRVLHSGLGITSDAFDGFIFELEKSLRVKVSLKEFEYESLLNRFKSFKSEVINN